MVYLEEEIVGLNNKVHTYAHTYIHIHIHTRSVDRQTVDLYISVGEAPNILAFYEISSLRIATYLSNIEM